MSLPVGNPRRPSVEEPPCFPHFGGAPGRGLEPDEGVFPVNIAVADKNPMVLAGLAALLNGDKRFRLLMTAGDGERFLKTIGHLPVGMAIIGWDLPLVHGRDVLFALSKRPNAPKVVVYSGTKDPTAPSETLRLGGAGFVSKLSPPARLLEVFAAVAAGDMVFPFVDIQKVRSDPLAALTHRERDLLAALERGHSNAQLAREFGISINTIKFHLRNLFGKLEVRNRTQAICQYLEMKR
jgi:two-component system nitrate/nitrite response regulator NarP